MTGKRIQAIIGHYGSGKTEIAMNLAIALAQRDPVTLVDLDIVNPYFRSAEHPQVLKAHGVKLVKPEFANTSVDIPSLAADVDCDGKVKAVDALAILRYVAKIIDHF